MSASFCSELNGIYFAILIILLSTKNCQTEASSDDRLHGNASVEYQLKIRLLRGYDTTSRPVRRDTSPVDTRVGMSLFHILDTSERHQTISAQVSIRVHWWDEYLSWSIEEFPIKRFWIPAKSIWRPDLIITNYANDEYSDYMNTNAVVEQDGGIMWTFPMVVKMYCTLDVRYFPFDTQDCNVTFVSWTYDGFQVALNHTGREDQKVYYNARNQEWKVTGITPHQELIKYPCCESPFPVIHFTIRMHRRCLFYVINLICPCLLIYFVSFLGFYLPIESGEKVNLEITVLLALVVFLLMVSETMPPTPDAIPILGLLFTVTMTMVALAVVMSVAVTRVYFADQQYQQQQQHALNQRHRHRYLRPPRYARWLAGLHMRWTASRRARKSRSSANNPLAMRELREQQQQQQQHQQRWGVDESLNSPLQPSQPVVPSTYFKAALQPLSRASTNGSCCNSDGRRPPVQQQQSELEFADVWKRAAFALDRIFFWVFTALTVGMFSAICSVAAPAFTEDHS